MASKVWRWIGCFQGVKVYCSFGSRKELGEGVTYVLGGELGEGAALWLMVGEKAPWLEGPVEAPWVQDEE